jgi:hypothetical protein
MKRVPVLLFVFMCFTVPVLAQTSTLSVMGNVYGTTVAFATTDTSTLLTAAINNAYGSAIDFTKVKAVLITVETNPARIAFGVTATTGLGHVIASGSSLRLPSQSLIRSARIISAGAGSAATLQVTLEY